MKLGTFEESFKRLIFRVFSTQQHRRLCRRLDHVRNYAIIAPRTLSVLLRVDLFCTRSVP